MTSENVETDCYYAKKITRGRLGVVSDVKGWSPKIDIDFFEEFKTQRDFLGLKVCKNMILSESRLYMAMQGCDLVLRVGA